MNDVQTSSSIGITDQIFCNNEWCFEYIEVFTYKRNKEERRILIISLLKTCISRISSIASKTMLDFHD